MICCWFKCIFYLRRQPKHFRIEFNGREFTAHCWHQYCPGFGRRYFFLFFRLGGLRFSDGGLFLEFDRFHPFVLVLPSSSHNLLQIFSIYWCYQIFGKLLHKGIKFVYPLSKDRKLLIDFGLCRTPIIKRPCVVIKQFLKFPRKLIVILFIISGIRLDRNRDLECPAWETIFRNFNS